MVPVLSFYLVLKLTGLTLARQMNVSVDGLPRPGVGRGRPPGPATSVGYRTETFDIISIKKKTIEPKKVRYFDTITIKR